MSSFKAKLHQILFSAPDPAEGAYSAPPDSLAVFEGPTSKGREGKGGEGREGERGTRYKGQRMGGRGRRRKGRQGKGEGGEGRGKEREGKRGVCSRNFQLFYALHRSRAPAALILSTCSSPLSQTAFTRFLTGCARTGYS